MIYGMVWHEDRKIISADDVNEDQAFLLNSNPLMVIMECMRLQNFRLVDMFQSLDTDKNAKISIHELVNGLLVSSPQFLFSVKFYRLLSFNFNILFALIDRKKHRRYRMTTL